MRTIKPLHLFWKRMALFNMFIKNIHVSLFSINLCLQKTAQEKVYLKTYLSNTPNTVDQIQIQIQIHGLKFDQIQIQIQIRRICICICICKYKYVFDPSPASDTIWQHRSWSTLAQVMACCLQHQAITWTNVDFWSVRFLGTHPRAISKWVPKLLFVVMSLKIILLKLLPYLPGTNELKPAWGPFH